MIVVALKFLEVGSRAIFVLLTSFLLEIEQAGQFGLVVTLQGLASFAFGYERHVDLMRMMVGQSPHAFDKAVARALTLFLVNYVWGVPVFVVALVSMAHLPASVIWMCVVIAISEQLMNLSYHMANVEPRYRKMLAVTVAKNLLIASAIIAGVLWSKLDLVYVLQAWTFGSAIGLVAIAVLWQRFRQDELQSEPLCIGLKHQYRASWTHFLLGITAVLTIQIDRLTVGALLSLEQAGIYFRHILLVSMLYQVFNIAFHNRILPRVFASGKAGTVEPLVHIVRREYLNVVAFWGATGVAILAVQFGFGSLLDRFRLEPVFLFGLLAISMLRARADLNALVFNALHRERLVFRLQLISFGLSLPVLILLAKFKGISGLIVASGYGALLYLLLSAVVLRRLTSGKTHGS